MENEIIEFDFLIRKISTCVDHSYDIKINLPEYALAAVNKLLTLDKDGVLFHGMVMVAKPNPFDSP